ncbi:type VI secretion system-associated protein VasI [Pseudomonas sp. R5(2019)]|uniref:type VI secretion system-associated protein VasI n=1 Tax=Pseudomonas sp. R5(2019) TaxID=2697566 RepID=UPI0014135A6A|nr:type VI secretion system-associated protein VasI [Pseudomonas sp. R5(2019)]NBA94157.1 type VI secretion system-associated protein TagO [Pseudomonas sp. R5(2019)]
MRLYGVPILVAITLLGCDTGQALVAAGRDCTIIVSALERLACFDSTAGTPPTPQAAASVPAEVSPARASVPDIVSLVRRNESGRQPEQTSMLLLRTDDALPGQSQVVISAPALDGPEPRTYLAISCLQNISRLQLLTAQPVTVNRANIRLLLDGRPLSASRPWQVLEVGTVTDGGRGLVAIEQLRHLTRPGQLLKVESDHAPFDGLEFDAGALHERMNQQREACHW